MGLSIALKNRDNFASVLGRVFYASVADVTFDSSYPTGGESLTVLDLKFPETAKIAFLAAEPALGFTFQYDRVNSKLKVLCPGFVAGAAGAVTVDDHPLTGVGSSTTKSVSFGPAGAATVALGGQVEVADTTNLSTVTTRIFAVAAYI
jgi:hypothetical protein